MAAAMAFRARAKPTMPFPPAMPCTSARSPPPSPGISKIGAARVVVGGLVAATGIVLLAHWMTDVLAGLAMGVVVERCLRPLSAGAGRADRHLQPANGPSKCDRSIRIFVRALTPALLQIGGLRGASELGCINRCPRTQTTGAGSVGYSTDGAFVECLSRALPELLGKFQQSDLVACLYEAAQAASPAR